jgi:outer membrane immunogenic protein
MKQLFLSVTAIATIMSASAFAADLPSIKSAPVGPAPMWTGFYAGLNIGGNVGTNNNTISNSYGSSPVLSDWIVQEGTSPPNLFLPLTNIGYAQSGSFSNSQNGIIGGGQIGFNYQLKNNYVVGLEADIQGTGISGTGRGYGLGSSATSGSFPIPGSLTSAVSSSSSAFSNQIVNAGVDWIGTVRGRLGYLLIPNLLIFSTGGLTYGSVRANMQSYTANYLSNNGVISDPPDPIINRSLSYVQPFFGSGQQSQLLVGWNVGGGLEWMFLENWSVKAEAIYWNMGNMNMASSSYAPSARTCTSASCSGIIGFTTGATFGNVQVNYQGIIARAGVNYHFDFGRAAPVVAKF